MKSTILKTIGLISALALLPLAACGPASQQKAKANDAPRSSASEGQVTLRSASSLQDWLMIARTQDGGYVHFNQRSIFRTDDGLARIQAQIRHGAPQLFQTEDARSETTIRYNVERINYVFRCADETFAIEERQIVNDSDVVEATIPGRPDLLRPAPSTGIARLVLPIACRGN